jgi:hypothetical protein
MAVKQHNKKQNKLKEEKPGYQQTRKQTLLEEVTSAAGEPI